MVDNIDGAGLRCDGTVSFGMVFIGADTERVTCTMSHHIVLLRRHFADRIALACVIASQHSHRLLEPMVASLLCV